MILFPQAYKLVKFILYIELQRYIKVSGFEKSQSSQWSALLLWVDTLTCLIWVHIQYWYLSIYVQLPYICILALRRLLTLTGWWLFSWLHKQPPSVRLLFALQRQLFHMQSLMPDSNQKSKPYLNPTKHQSLKEDKRWARQAHLLVRSITGAGVGSLTRRTEGATARAGRALGVTGANGGTGVGFSVLLPNVAERSPAPRAPLLPS
jgi:hypothetical protein